MPAQTTRFDRVVAVTDLARNELPFCSEAVKKKSRSANERFQRSPSTSYFPTFPSSRTTPELGGIQSRIQILRLRDSWPPPYRQYAVS